jgi:hypothetical protein
MSRPVKEVYDEIRALEEKLQGLYVERNRLTGQGPPVLPKERPFLLKQGNWEESRVVTITKEVEDGKLEGESEPYPQSTGDRTMSFSLGDHDEIVSFRWSHVTFYWDDDKCDYYCSYGTCGQPHSFYFGDKAKEHDERMKERKERKEARKEEERKLSQIK